MFTEDVPNEGAQQGEHLALTKTLVNQISVLAEEVAGLREALEAQVNRGKLYDTKSLAKRWGVCDRSVANAVETGLVPTYIQTTLRFTHDAVEAYERSRSGAKHARRAKAYKRRPAIVRDPYTLEVISGPDREKT